MNEIDPPANRPRARKRGCVLKGCLVLFIVLMLLGIIIGVVGTYVYYGFVVFFSQEPVPVRIYPATDAQYAAVLAKVAPFNQALEAGTEAPLELTADDLDVLIARDPAWADLRGKLYLAIVDNQLVADVNTHAQDDPGPQVIYFSGRFIMGASIAGGEFTAVLRRMETLSGHPLPSILAHYVTNPSFAVSLNEMINRRIKDNSFLARDLARIRTALIEHNRILIVAAGKPGRVVTPAASPPLTPAGAPTPTPVAASPAPE